MTLTIIGVWMVVRALTLPAWYSNDLPDCSSGRDGQYEGAAHRAGRLLETRIASELHLIRPSHESSWTLRVSLEEAQSWIACRAPEWGTHTDELPWLRDLSGMRLSYSSEWIVLTAPLGASVGSIALRPVHSDDGWEIELGTAWIGMLRVPHWTLRAVGYEMPLVSIPESIPLADGRTVAIVSITLRGAVVDIELEPRPAR